MPQIAQPMMMYNPLNFSNQYQMMAPTANFQGTLPTMFPNMIPNMGQPQVANSQVI